LSGGQAGEAGEKQYAMEREHGKTPAKL